MKLVPHRVTLVQAIPGVPAAFQNARQAAGGIHARVYGNIFDGATIRYTWPAYMGPLSVTSVTTGLSGMISGSDDNRYTVRVQCTNQLCHPPWCQSIQSTCGRPSSVDIMNLTIALVTLKHESSLDQDVRVY